jgi:RNA polymerase sigma factor (sigma-70 family)
MPRAGLPVVALAERFQQAVGSYLLQLVGDLDRALVLTEQTFVRAHRAGVDTQSDLSAQAWLFRIATQLALAELRGRPLRAGSHGPHSQADPSSPLAAEREVVRAVLGQLRPDERAVLLLCDREGLSEADVAAILGERAERVQQLLGRARTRFRQLYVLQHALAHPHPNGATRGA